MRSSVKEFMFLAALLPDQYFITFSPCFASEYISKTVLRKNLQHIKCLICIHIKAKGMNKYLKILDFSVSTGLKVVADKPKIKSMEKGMLIQSEILGLCAKS